MSQHDVLLFEKSLTRIAAALAERCPSVRPVCWHADGRLTVDGSPVTPEDISPVAGWLSGDVLRARLLEEYSEALVAAGPVQWAQSVNAGLDHPVYPKLSRAGVRLSKSGAQSIPIAEYVLAYALHHAQNISLREQAERAGEWKPHRFAELWHSNFLIVGYGHIGRNVARRAKAFDADVTVVRRGPEADYADRVIGQDALPDHLGLADVVVLACPATDRTRGMVNAGFLARMKPGSLLVNVARGSLVDEAALVSALDEGRPGRAVLDVFETEPLPGESPLWSHDAVTVTAHISNAGSGTPSRGDELFISNLERFLADGNPVDEVAPAEIQTN